MLICDIRILMFLGTGYIERAIAILQAQVELSFFSPTEIKPHSLPLDELESWWDSETPRFADDGSVGWKNQLTPFQHISSSDTTEQIETTHQVEVESGSLIDQYCSSIPPMIPKLVRPQKLTEATSESDPESFIDFGEVRDFLCCIMEPRSKLRLALIWLEHLGCFYSMPQSSSNDSIFAGPVFAPLPQHLLSVQDDQAMSGLPEDLAKVWATEIDTLVPFDLAWYNNAPSSGNGLMILCVMISSGTRKSLSTLT